MPLNCECLEKASSCCCPCKLNIIGYISAWVGIIWRIAVVTLLSSTLSSIAPQDPSVFSILLGACLAYILASFIVNCLFIYGIFKEKRHLLLPYITIVAFEMGLAVILSSGVIMLAFAINAIPTAIYITFIAILVIGVFFILWLYNVLFYKDLEFEAQLTTGKKTNISLTNVHRLDV